MPGQLVLMGFCSQVWFNNKGYISMIAYMNVLNNAVLRTQLPSNLSANQHGITLITHPMNRTEAQLEEFLL